MKLGSVKVWRGEVGLSEGPARLDWREEGMSGDICFIRHKSLSFDLFPRKKEYVFLLGQKKRVLPHVEC